MSMKIRFQGQRLAPVSDGIPVRYGPARRSLPRIRWLLIALLVTSPLIYVLWLILRGGLVVDASGRLTYETVRAGAVVSGVVAEVLAEENGTVQAGEPLIQLENPEIRGRLQHLQDELSRLEGEQREAKANAEAALMAVNEEIETLQSLVESEERWVEQMRRLEALGLVTEREQYQAMAETKRTRRQLLDAINRRTDLTRIQTQGDSNLRAREEDLRLALDMANNNLKYLTIKAPANGDVVELLVEPGDTVGPGTTLLTMTRPSPPELIAYLRPADGNFARHNGRVRVRLPDGTQLAGRVTERPRLTGRIPTTMQTLLQDANAALMVKVALIDRVPEAMAVHGLPVTVEFARGPSVVASRLRFPSAIAGQTDTKTLE